MSHSHRHPFVKKAGPPDERECALCGGSELAVQHSVQPETPSGPPVTATMRRTRVQPTAPFSCLACGAGNGEYHRQGCSRLRELDEAVRRLSTSTSTPTGPAGVSVGSPAPEVPTPPAPTGELGDPAQGSTAQADWRDTRPTNIGDSRVLDDLVHRQRHRPIILDPAPSGTFDVGPSRNTRDIEDLQRRAKALEERATTLERHAEAVGEGLSRCEGSVAAMTVTHADRIETIEDEVRSLKRAVLELRELNSAQAFGARYAASDQKLRILINGEPAPAVPGFTESVYVPRVGDVVIIHRVAPPAVYHPWWLNTVGVVERQVPWITLSSHRIRVWHAPNYEGQLAPGTDPHIETISLHPAYVRLATDEERRVAEMVRDAVAKKRSEREGREGREGRDGKPGRPSRVRLTREVPAWSGGDRIEAGTEFDVRRWEGDDPLVRRAGGRGEFILHPGEWEPAPLVVVDPAEAAKSPAPEPEEHPSPVRVVSTMEERVDAGVRVEREAAQAPAEPAAAPVSTSPTVSTYAPKVGDVVRYEGDFDGSFSKDLIIVSTDGRGMEFGAGVYYKLLDEPKDTPTRSVDPSDLRFRRDSTEEERRAVGLVATPETPWRQIALAYASEIAQRPDLVAEGFCQGSVFDAAREQATISGSQESRARAHRPRVVCLCGSTRFKSRFMEESKRLGLEGKIVLSVACFPHADDKASPEEALGGDAKRALDELHRRKIDLADEVLVLNVGGYIGDSTRSEIQYAWDHRKTVTFLEPVDDIYAPAAAQSAEAWGGKRRADVCCPSCGSERPETRRMCGNINDRYPCRDAWHGAEKKEPAQPAQPEQPEWARVTPAKPGSRVVRLLADVPTPDGLMRRGTVAWVANWDMTGHAVVISTRGDEVTLDDDQWEAVP